MLKAIETIYNGYRFRSRLEARWAVFFDAMGIKYEYEKEGYDLDGTWYLPDFWLPELKIWIEVKGQGPTEEEHMKCMKLMQHANPCKGKEYEFPKEYDKNVYLFAGDIPFPDAKDRENCCCAHAYNPLGYHVDGYGWAECPFCRVIGVTQGCSIQGLSCTCERKYIRIEAIDDILLDIHCQKSNAFMDEIYIAKRQALLSWYNTPRLIAAYTAARSARFEHKDNLMRSINTQIKRVQQMQTKAGKPSQQPSQQDLTIKKVRDHWENAKEQVESRMNDSEVGNFLFHCRVVGVDASKSVPMISVRPCSEFGSIPSLDPTRIELVRTAIELTMSRESGQAFKIRLMKSLSGIEPPSDEDELLPSEEVCDNCGVYIGILADGEIPLCDSCWDNKMSNPRN